MSTSAPHRPEGAARTDRIRSSSDLGATLRSVLLSPQRGYRGALKVTARRERAGRRPAEGTAPSVLAAAGGAGLMLLWLKAGAVVGLRHVPGSGFRWGYLIGAVAGGAVVGLLAQGLWGQAGPMVARRLGATVTSSELRLVWGGSSLPHVFAVVVLLPLDLLIAGRASFTDERLSDPVTAAWISLSIALAVALTGWSAYLFVRGTQEAAETTIGRAVLLSFVAGFCLVAVTASVLFAAAAAGS